MNRISVEVRPWVRAPDKPALESNVVHVWSASLAAASSRVDSLLHLLAADETARADRFHFQKDRDHFIVARGLLRVILSRYLELPPTELQFRYGADGKPALVPCPRDEMLRFNLSHSNGLAIYAITRGREIGVDVEYMREDFPGFEIAEQFFSVREVATLRALPTDRRQEAFFTFWTLKEAYLKAQGQGLTLPLDQLDVSAFLEGPARSVADNDGLRPLSGWTLQKFIPASGYIGALAVKGEAREVKWWRWLDPNASPSRNAPPDGVY